MSRRGISIPLRICGSGVRGISPVRWVARGFRVRPVPSELWRGRAVAVWCVAWWLGVWVVKCLRGFRVRPVPSELWRGRAVAVWCVAWRLGVLRAGRGGLSPFSVLPVGKSGARRGAGAVRSDIRVPEAKRGRVPL